MYTNIYIYIQRGGERDTHTERERGRAREKDTRTRRSKGRADM